MKGASECGSGAGSSEDARPSAGVERVMSFELLLFGSWTSDGSGESSLLLVGSRTGVGWEAVQPVSGLGRWESQLKLPSPFVSS